MNQRNNLINSKQTNKETKKTKTNAFKFPSIRMATQLSILATFDMIRHVVHQQGHERWNDLVCQSSLELSGDVDVVDEGNHARMQVHHGFHLKVN
jgi:hypothetical protein